MADSSYLGNYMASDGAANGAVSNYVEVGDIGGMNVLSTVGALAATYHGYKRNNSIGWALLWGVLGGAAPLIVGVIAVAQGFGKRKGQ